MRIDRYGRDDETLSQASSRWWRGADPGRKVEVATTLAVPTHRSDQEVLELFAEFAEQFSGGYPSKVTVSRRRGAP